MRRTFYFLSALFLITSCGQDITSGVLTTGSSSSAATANTCGCESTVDPVCANANGQYVSFKNGCLAQCSGFRYTMGSCSSDNCNSNSGPVCGVVNVELSPRVYSDECALLKAGADQVEDSECDL